MWASSAERYELDTSERFEEHMLVSIFVGEVGCCNVSWPRAQVDERQRGQDEGSCYVHGCVLHLLTGGVMCGSIIGSHACVGQR